MSKPKRNDFFELAKKTLPAERIQEAHEEAKKEILNIKLSELRKEFGIKQTDITSFSQPAVSRLEARRDMKISTLLQYVHSLGLEIEIKVREKKKGKRKEVILLEG